MANDWLVKKSVLFSIFVYWERELFVKGIGSSFVVLMGLSVDNAAFSSPLEKTLIQHLCTVCFRANKFAYWIDFFFGGGNWQKEMTVIYQVALLFLGGFVQVMVSSSHWPKFAEANKWTFSAFSAIFKTFQVAC